MIKNGADYRSGRSLFQKPSERSRNSDAIDLHFPTMLPQLDECSLVAVFQVKVEPVGIYSNFSIDVPVIIGTEPLDGAFKGKSEGEMIQQYTVRFVYRIF